MRASCCRRKAFGEPGGRVCIRLHSRAVSSPVDPERARRALFLTADPAGPGFLVNGADAAWYVDPTTGCSCPDRAVQEGACRHELAIELRGIRPELLGALRVATTPVADWVSRVRK